MFPAGDSRFRSSCISLQLDAGPLVVRVVESGPAEAPVTVVCVHGWACSVYSYRRLMPLIAARGMRAVAIDLPGHGLSGKPANPAFYTLDAQASCVLAAMDVLGVGGATLVGHSMGGPICARIAVLAPARVSGLVLLAPAGFGTEWDLRILRAVTPRFVIPVLPALVHRWMAVLVARSAYGVLYRPTARDVDEYWAPSQFHGFMRALWSLLHRFEWSAGLDRGFGSISVPTAILVGGLDNLVIRRWVRRYATVIPQASLRVVDGCGHVVPEEAPELAACAIGELIS